MWKNQKSNDKTKTWGGQKKWGEQHSSVTVCSGENHQPYCVCIDRQFETVVYS